MREARSGMVEWLRDALAAAALLMLGHWFAGAHQVRAASSEMAFQLAGVNESSSLLVYEPGTKTVYVYRGATVGNSALQCSYKFVLGTPGGVVRRVECPVGTLVP